MVATEEVLDLDLLRMRLEAHARRYAALAAVHEQVVRRLRRVLELLYPQALLVSALQPQGGDGLLEGLDLLIERLESLADPAALFQASASVGTEADGKGSPQSPILSALTDIQQQFIGAVGSGLVLLPEIAERMGIHRQRVYEVATQLQKIGLLESAEVEIPLSRAVRQAGIAGRVRVIRLSDAGKEVYRRTFGGEPVDTWGDLVAKYKSLEAAFFVRGVAELISGLNALEERVFDFTVVDPAVATDEEIASIGGRREYSDGNEVVRPDLLVLMRPRKGGAEVLAAVEVEFGNYSADRLRDKWRRALLCYPPVPLYVVAPNTIVRDRLFREMEGVRKQMLSAGHVFTYWTRYVFYTADEIARIGLLSPGQIIRLEAMRKAGEPEIVLPKYFFQKPAKDEQDG